MSKGPLKLLIISKHQSYSISIFVCIGGVIVTKAVNDATGQKAGDIFQYLVALRDCFELEEGDTLQIEVNGDVSILTGTAGNFKKKLNITLGKHH